MLSLQMFKHDLELFVKTRFCETQYLIYSELVFKNNVVEQFPHFKFKILS